VREQEGWTSPEGRAAEVGGKHLGREGKHWGGQAFRGGGAGERGLSCIRGGGEGACGPFGGGAGNHSRKGGGGVMRYTSIHLTQLPRAVALRHPISTFRESIGST
jgi:hypothetical protein